ncbi:MAG TPA: segregation/condensation protein A, partial [Acidimicrobiales bacterium]|nr:segregation/condensation protein A [Acidimicrobiales bacterium]
KLRDALARALAPKPQPRVAVDHIHRVRVSVSEAVAELVDELSRRGSDTFARLTAGLEERLEVIVHFLAVLELYKRGLVDLEQAVTFGDLAVRWTGGEDADRELADVEEYRG